MKLTVTAVLCASLLGTAFGQNANPHDGNWKLVLRSPTGSVLSDVELIVEGATGFYQSKMTNRFNKCVGLRSPIEIGASSAETLKFTVRPSTVVKGCPDSVFELVLVDSKLQGTAWLLETPNNKLTVLGERAK